jgi:hypothetical protein
VRDELLETGELVDRLYPDAVFAGAKEPTVPLDTLAVTDCSPPVGETQPIPGLLEIPVSH